MREELRRAALEWPWDAAAAAYHRTRRTRVLGPLMVAAIESATRNARWIVAPVQLGPLRGMRLAIDPRVQADVVVGAYERRLSRHVAGILRPGDLAFDVGSHLGYFGVLMSTVVGSSGSVVCFEPDPGLHEALTGNVTRNGEQIPAEVSVAQLAIGPRRGKMAFETGGHSTRGRLGEHGDAEVDVITLDDAVSRYGTPHFVKVDVEGGERDVLEGGSALIGSHAAAFGIEIHSRELGDACRNLLEDAGYACCFITEAGRSETYLLAKPTDVG